MIGIYKIFNTLNGECYIGSSLSIQHRLDYHLYSLRYNNHKNKHLQNAFNKYGNVFDVELLIECKKEDLIRNEQYFIDLLHPAYNLCSTAGSRLGHPMSDKTKEKMRQLNLGRRHSEEAKLKMRKPHKYHKSNTTYEGWDRPRDTQGRFCSLI